MKGQILVATREQLIGELEEMRQRVAELEVSRTKHRRTEEALRIANKNLARKAAELEEANEELSQHTYAVSHDVRAPLRAIHNYAEFLTEDLEGALDEEQKEYLNGLMRAVQQAEELVNDLLELSRVGRQEPNYESIHIGDFIRDMIASFDLPPDVEIVMGNDWPTIDAEPILLRQIFQNLITNAAKFNKSPCKRVELGYTQVGEEHYEFFVRDNGIGIAPQHQQRIFRVFQRLHTSKEYEGSGVGLAIVKKAVSKIHASIRLESKLGEGSTFFVALPRTQGKEESI